MFKESSLQQTLRQAELDVVGIIDDTVYMAEAAFLENGLQYYKQLLAIPIHPHCFTQCKIA